MKKTLGYGKNLLKQISLFILKDVLTSEWKAGNVLYWGRGYIFFSTGGKKAMDSFKINKDLI